MLSNSKTEELRNNNFLTRGMTFLLAIAGGILVANLYYNQPLLSEIAKAFNVTSQEAGLISTFTQLGYALGIFLLVPLGDIKEKRKLILILTFLVIISLLGVATAQNLIWIYIASFVVGLTTVSPQIITPLAAELARPEERGKVVGTVVSGLLFGILLARTVSGYIGYIAGWRFMFVFAAILICLLDIILYLKLPVTTSNENLTYKELIKSVIKIACKYKTLRYVSISGSMLFGAFSMFWTTLTFFLEGSPYYMHSNQIGLFGLLGAAGALCAPIIGRLNDKKNPKIVAVICSGIGILSYLIFYFFGMNIFGVILGVVLLDLGIQGAQVSNQTRIYSLNQDERSRINTVFVVSNFTGAAVGSSLGSLVWNLYNWNGVCIAGLIMITIALVTGLFLD
jgi:predicted MFS family arabinose efflux permease